MQSCMPRVHHQDSKTNLFYWNLQSFPKFSLSPCWKFQLAICLRMISQDHNVFDTISSHEFFKHLICKMAPSITDYGSGCPKSAENISL